MWIFILKDVVEKLCPFLYATVSKSTVPQITFSGTDGLDAKANFGVQDPLSWTHRWKFASKLSLFSVSRTRNLLFASKTSSFWTPTEPFASKRHLVFYFWHIKRIQSIWLYPFSVYLLLIKALLRFLLIGWGGLRRLSWRVRYSLCWSCRRLLFSWLRLGSHCFLLLDKWDNLPKHSLLY